MSFVVIVVVALVGLLAAGAVLWMTVRVPTVTLLPPEDPEPAAPRPAEAENRFFGALRRTREAVGGAFSAVFGRATLDESAWEALEEALVRADVGAKTSMGLVGELRTAGVPPSELRDRLRDAIRSRLTGNLALARVGTGPLVVLVVGVNGSGKTTTIGKLAARYRREGKSVLLAAGDTFRAGAIEQLKVWGERAQVPVVAHQEGADPAAVCHDAVQAAVARGVEIVICDTAGRLQAHQTLMDELAKVRRVISKVIPGAPHETLLVLDGTMGQNALSQARIFAEVAGVTGIVLTKLDGTARGGVVVAIAVELGIPVKLVGLGEKLEDLRDFDPDAFVEGLLPGGAI